MKTKETVTANDLPAEVMRAIEQGRKIEAIKLLRDATGLGLAHAKVLVDRAAWEHGPKSPTPRIVDEQANVGKLLSMLLIVLFAYLFYRYFVAA